jgi:hypothetical protein
MRKLITIAMMALLFIGTGGHLYGQQKIVPGCPTCPDMTPAERQKLMDEHQPFIGKSNLTMPASFAKIQSSAKTSLSNKGTDFWLLFMRNFEGQGVELFLDITADETTSGTVSVPGLGFSQSFNVTANTITRVIIPVGAMIMNSGTVEALGVRVVSQNDVTVYGTNQRAFSTDSFLGLPVSILGTQYLAMTYFGPSTTENNASQLAIVSPYNNNVITITPSQATRNGQPAGVPFNVTLNQGETYLVRGAAVTNDDLTGTIVESSLPVALFSGGACVNIPPGFGFCDHIVQQIPPVSAWGLDFVTRPLEGRQQGDTWRFLASQNNTQVTINGSLAATLNFGDYYETVLTASSYVQSNRPILTVQFANGNQWDGSGNPGDPFMMVIPPFQQFLNGYTFATPADGFVSNYFTVTVQNEGIAGMRLDGASLNAGAFAAIPGTDFSAAAFPISINSSYNITNLDGYPFGLYVYGFNADDSYGYPGGLSLIAINPGSGPGITIAPATLDLFCTSLEPGADVEISAVIAGDGETQVQSASLYYRKIGDEDYVLVPMVEGAGDTWSASIPAADVLSPGLEFYIVATDGQITVSSPSLDPTANPYILGVGNVPPQITHTPVLVGAIGEDVLIEAEVFDDTDFVQSVQLFYRIAGGTPVYTVLEMTNTDGDNYAATIPGAQMTAQGIEYYIKATDNHGVSCTFGFADAPYFIEAGDAPPPPPPPPPPPIDVPLSNWAIILGMMLMLTFIIIRFKRIG